jgi:hypothetical protein
VLARDISDYNIALSKISLDCDYSYPHFMERVYPIDAVQSNLDRIAIDALDLKQLGHGSHGHYGFGT